VLIPDRLATEATECPQSTSCLNLEFTCTLSCLVNRWRFNHLVLTFGAYSLPVGSIGIEITENVFIDRPDKTRQVLDKLKNMGLNFLLDDFGTGFSSMRHIRTIPFNGLKIDRSSAAGVNRDYEMAVLVKAMINMAHSLNLSVVAEGVECEGELQFLQDHDCDNEQAYLHGRPMPAEHFFDLLQAARP